MNDFYVDDSQRFFDWFIVYDLEALLIEANIETAKTKWSRKHLPISVSICSNVLDYTNPVCIVDQNEDILVSQMVKYMVRIAEKSYSLARENGYVYLLL